jgi:hypothetical protein
MKQVSILLTYDVLVSFKITFLAELIHKKEKYTVKLGLILEYLNIKDIDY